MTVISLLLWPAFLYHDVYGHIYAKVQPFLVQFEQSMDSLERKEKRQKRKTLVLLYSDDILDRISDEICLELNGHGSDRFVVLFEKQGTKV